MITNGVFALVLRLRSITDLFCFRIQSPEELYDNGIYVNDLSMHDSSRDVILAGSQRDPELNIALSQVFLVCSNEPKAP